MDMDTYFDILYGYQFISNLLWFQHKSGPLNINVILNTYLFTVVLLTSYQTGESSRRKSNFCMTFW